MHSEDNQAIVTRFWDAFSRRDYDSPLALMEDRDFTWWIPDSPKTFCLAGSRDREGLKALLGGFATHAPEGIKTTSLAWTTQGERVAMEAESYAVVSGKVYNNLYHFLHIVRDGKQRMVKEYLDTQHVAEILYG